jgi:putative membrane protein
MDFSIAASISGLPDFLMYLGASLILTVVYAVLYGVVTTHNELKLIRENNTAAAIAFSGSLLGFVTPLASAIHNSVSLGDCILWGLIALVVQVLAYLLLRMAMDDLSQRIEKGQIAAGVWLGAGSLAAGMINAACMTY